MNKLFIATIAFTIVFIIVTGIIIAIGAYVVFWVTSSELAALSFALAIFMVAFWRISYEWIKELMK